MVILISVITRAVSAAMRHNYVKGSFIFGKNTLIILREILIQNYNIYQSQIYKENNLLQLLCNEFQLKRMRIRFIATMKTSSIKLLSISLYVKFRVVERDI